jgi:HK97 gp10 family phage protein
MSDDFMIEMNELNRLAVDLGQASITAPLKASAAIRKTAFDIVGTAQTFVPVDTGATKNSIHATSGDARPLGAGSLAANIGPTTEYAPHLEFGTVNMAPHAFMGPAADRHTPDLVQALGQLAADI